MSENITSNSAVSGTSIETNTFSAKTHQTSLKKHEQEFLDIYKQISKLKRTLGIKYQQLDELKDNIADNKEIKSRVNRKMRELNTLKINIPNFLIIGVQKGGTTWLHENLKNHPQIFLPEGRKELEFFSYYKKKINDLGLSGYLQPFNQFDNILQTDTRPAIGEATPSYFWSTNPARKWTNTPKYFNNDIPGSVFNVLGSKLKLILCLRDPVQRAISAYFHHVKRERISCKSQSIFDVGHLYGIIDMGFYSQHLNAWLEKFDLDNFKILVYEKDIKIKDNQQKTIENICNFLEVDYQLYPSSMDLNKYHNKGLQYRIDKDGVVLISPDGGRETVVVTQDEIKQLRAIYYEDYLSLQKITNLDLSECWGFVKS